MDIYMQIRHLKTILAISCSISSGVASGQSLECQLMRDEILSQSNQQRQLQQQQQMQQQQQALAYAQLDPMQRAQMSIYQSGQQLGSALSNMGQPSLEQKIQIYKQRCER
jgi:hypothetical protein